MSFTSRGQATIEYLFLLVFIVGLTFKMVGGFTSFMTDSIGNLGHVLSYNLSVGVCKEECFYTGFRNGHQAN
jgi:hypothetical protein